MSMPVPAQNVVDLAKTANAAEEGAPPCPLDVGQIPHVLDALCNDTAFDFAGLPSAAASRGMTGSALAQLQADVDNLKAASARVRAVVSGN